VNKTVVLSGAPNGAAVPYTADATGTLQPTGTTITPFGQLPVAVRTATADVNGDGFDDVIMVTGPGVPARFAVVSGADGFTLLVPPTDPFGGNFTGGAFVAAGDLNGDGRSEFVFCPDQGGGPNVVIYSLNADGSLATPRAFFALGNPTFRGGARPAMGDINHDGTPDLAIGAGFLGGPNVEVHDGKAVAVGNYDQLIGGGFFAFDGADATTLRNGVFLTIGDLNGDGFGELIVGGGPGGGPRVLALDGKMLSAGNVTAAYAAPVANFFFGDDSNRGGVRLTTANLDGDGRGDLIVGSGEGVASRARVYLGKNFTTGGEPAQFQDLDPYAAVLPGGVYVG
jgi:hypothetical protein